MTDRTTEHAPEREDEPDTARERVDALRAEVAELREAIERHLATCPAATR